MEDGVVVSPRVYKLQEVGNRDRRLLFIEFNHYLAKIGTHQDFHR